MHSEKIGVLDSGIGGLTVVKELQKYLPNEDIIYYGDNINCPYGNKTQTEIIDLTEKILGFFEEKNVKIVVVACNTISSIVKKLSKSYKFLIIDIVSPTAEYISKQDISEIGLIATKFTIGSQIYNTSIEKLNPAQRIIGEDSEELAQKIESVNINVDELNNIIKTHIENITDKSNVKKIILGCTHYPVYQEYFEENAPEIEFINPAKLQAIRVGDVLDKIELISEFTTGNVEIYTTGNKDIYNFIIKKLKIKNIAKITQINK